jgi:hypothetical protein
LLGTNSCANIHIVELGGTGKTVLPFFVLMLFGGDPIYLAKQYT